VCPSERHAAHGTYNMPRKISPQYVDCRKCCQLCSTTTVSRLSRWASTFVCNTVGVTCSTATVGLHTFARCKFLATKTCANLSLLQFPLLERDSRDILHQPSSNLDSDRQVDRQTNHLRYPLVCKSVTAHSVTTTVKKWAKTRECRMRRRERKCAENYNK